MKKLETENKRCKLSFRVWFYLTIWILSKDQYFIAAT
jgi:hypothetical protein